MLVATCSSRLTPASVSELLRVDIVSLLHSMSVTVGQVDWDPVVDQLSVPTPLNSDRN